MGTLFGSIVKMLIAEGSRDKALSVYLPLFHDRGIEVSQSQLKQALLRKFVSEAGMHNLSLGGNYYLCGIARYYFNGDLTSNKRVSLLYPNVKDRFNADVCKRLDALINILRNAYIDSVGTKWEQPEDFGTLSLQSLLRKYNKKINKELGIVDTNGTVDNKPKEQFSHKAGKKYTYEILYTYDDARKYNAPTEPGAWCITYGKHHFDSYIKRLDIHYVVFRMNGYEKVERKVGKGFTKQKPHDLYGNSLICVLQSNTSPEPIYITSRWNHGSTSDMTNGTEADHAYSWREFLNVIGDDGTILDTCFREWKRNVGNGKSNGSLKAKETLKLKGDALRSLKYAQMLISNGKNPVELFSSIRACGQNKMGSWRMEYVISEEDKRSWVKRGGLCLCELPIDNGQYVSAFMKNGQILYDVGFFIHDNMNSYCEMNVTKYSGAVVIFRLWTRTRKEMYYVYNGKLGRFLEVDGHYEFRSIPGSIDKSKYMIVGISNNQFALVDKDTFRPVTSKGGEVWFEKITTQNRYVGRGPITRTDNLDEDSFVLMVYDSSAMEQYVFDCKKGRFLDDAIEYNGTRYTISTTTIDYYLIVGGKRYLPYSNTDDVRVAGNVYIFVCQDDRSLLELGGYSEFSYIWGDEYGKDIITFRPAGERSRLGYYITKIGKPLEINGQILFNKLYVSIVREYEHKSGWSYASRDCRLLEVYDEDMRHLGLFWLYDINNERFIEKDGTNMFRAGTSNVRWGDKHMFYPAGKGTGYTIDELIGANG